MERTQAELKRDGALPTECVTGEFTTSFLSLLAELQSLNSAWADAVRADEDDDWICVQHAPNPSRVRSFLTEWLQTIKLGQGCAPSICSREQVALVAEYVSGKETPVSSVGADGRQCLWNTTSP